jgi:hypothetical protein
VVSSGGDRSEGDVVVLITVLVGAIVVYFSVVWVACAITIIAVIFTRRVSVEIIINRSEAVVGIVAVIFTSRVSIEIEVSRG